jgi:hypothetical protein
MIDALLRSTSDDLAVALTDVAAIGAARIAGALNHSICQQLLAESLNCRFERKPPQMGQVRQETEQVTLTEGLDGYPVINTLRGQFTAAVQTLTEVAPALARWQPNDVGIQRYWPEASIGITPHRYGKRFAILVAVFSLTGRARFALCSDRAGSVVSEWLVECGDLVLLRAPGLCAYADADDPRPFHTINPPIGGERYSLAFRMDTRFSACDPG